MDGARNYFNILVNGSGSGWTWKQSEKHIEENLRTRSSDNFIEQVLQSNVCWSNVIDLYKIDVVWLILIDVE